MRLVLFLLSITSGYLHAQTTVIMADALVDVVEQKIINHPVIFVENDRITKVAQGDNVNIPEDAHIINLAGKTLLPGLMDMHVHLNGDADVHGYRRLAVSLPQSTLTSVVNAKRTLMAGFTTVRNVGAPGFADVALRDAINNGDIVGPRMFVAGPSLGTTGGHCDNNLLPYEYNAKGLGVADGPWKIREAVRRNVKYGADLIKFCATGGVLSKGTKVGAQQYSQEEMDALVAEAKLQGIITAAHAHGTNGIKAAIKAGVTSIEHASFLDDEAIKLAIKHDTYLSMDVYVTEYILGEGEKAGILEESLAKERTVGHQQRENFRKAVKAGVKMVFGSDAGVYPHGDNGKQFARMVKFGMTPMQAIQAATINAATLLMQQDNLGSIQVGKLADIIAVSGNPLTDIALLESVDWVMKQGQQVKPL